MNEREITRRIERLTGKTVAGVGAIRRGYTPALRLRIGLSDGSSVFAKVGVNEMTSGWLRRERWVYESLTGTFLPRCLGWDDDGTAPILLLEDLSDAYWPPPWNDAQVRLMLDTLPAVWQSSLPDLPNFADASDVLTGWEQVARDPAPFLSLKLVTEKWLRSALPILAGVNGAEVARGDDLLHGDTRSDNLCFHEGRVILIDWNHVCRGNGRLDMGFWLPSLEAEGGPKPETVLPDGAEIAAIVSGYFAARAGLPVIPDAPFVRRIQQVQLKTALPWAARALGLPPPDGELQ